VRHLLHLLYLIDPSGNDAREKQEQAHKEQILRIAARNSKIKTGSDYEYLKAVDDIAFAPNGFWVADSRDHQQREYEHPDWQIQM
jgi:hypothetical protein